MPAQGMGIGARPAPNPALTGVYTGKNWGTGPAPMAPNAPPGMPSGQHPVTPQPRPIMPTIPTPQPQPQPAPQPAPQPPPQPLQTMPQQQQRPPVSWGGRQGEMYDNQVRPFWMGGR
jgi:hypothetical protein